MANSYKQYKTYLPQKWKEFDDCSPALLHTKTKFVHCLGNNSHGTSSLLSAKVDSPAKVTEVGRLRGSEKWMAEMDSYMAEMNKKEDGAVRTKALQLQLTQIQQDRMAQKERELSAPTLNGKKMPANFFAFQVEHPVKVQKYQALLAAAAQLDQEKIAARCEAHLQEKAESVEKEVSDDLRLIEKRQAQRQKRILAEAKFRGDLSREREGKVGEFLYRSQLNQLEKVEKQQELSLCRDETFLRWKEQRQIERSEKESARRQRFAEHKAELEGRLLFRTRGLANFKDHRTKMEQELEDINDDWLQKLEEKRKEAAALARDHLVKAQERLGEKLERKAEEGRTCAAKRERQLGRVLKERNIMRKEIAEVSWQRMSATQQSIEAKWGLRRRAIEESIAQHHSSTPPPPLRAPSELAKFQDLTLQNKQRMAEETQKMDEESDQRIFKSTDTVERLRTAARGEAQKRHHAEEEHRRDVRFHGGEIFVKRMGDTENDIAARTKKSEQSLKRLYRRREIEQEERRRRNAERTASAMDYVHVGKVVALHDLLEERAERVGKRQAEQRALEQACFEEKERARKEKVERMRKQVEETAANKERKLKEFLHEHEARAASALEQREEQLYNESVHLRKEADVTFKKACSAADTVEQNFLIGMKQITDDENEYRRRMHIKHRERRHVQMENAERNSMRKEMYEMRKDALDNERTGRTVSRLEYVYSRLNPRSRITEGGYRFSPPSLSPVRARTTSPT